MLHQAVEVASPMHICNQKQNELYPEFYIKLSSCQEAVLLTCTAESRDYCVASALAVLLPKKKMFYLEVLVVTKFC
jgi:hypothetical protein